jgi:hypothetical protein
VKRKVTGASFIMALLLSATGLTLVNLATADPMAVLPYITIKSDGSVEPQTGLIKQDGNVYTLTSDLMQKYAIKIQRSNIVFDGAGHVIDGSNPSGYGYGNKGLSVEGVTNVTVKDIEVRGFINRDISIESSSNCSIFRVKARIFHLWDSSFNTIAESNIAGFDLLMRFSNSNMIIRSNITSVDLGAGYSNTFFENNFASKFVFPVSEANFWDNGSIGNYWSDYKGTDANGDSIGDTPYVINADNQDRYPLMKPWHPTIPFDTVPPRIAVSSPVHRVYNETSVPLTFVIFEASSLMSYSLDGQDNVTIAGNATLSELPNGSHNLTVYVTDRSGNTGASETVYFSVDVPFPTIIVVASVTSVAVAGVGLLVYFKKRHH